MFKKIFNHTNCCKTRKTQRGKLRSEKGFVLAMVLVLSAITLTVITIMIYVITTGTQISGLQKRYKTALEAAEGGADIFYQLIALRGESSGQNAFINNLNTYNVMVSSTTPSACSGMSSGVAVTYNGFAAKLLTPSTSWTNCNRDLTIDPTNPSTYDMRVQLGTTTRYNMYAKIVATVPGNTGGDVNLRTKGVVASNSGEVAVSPIPSLYAVEAVAVNNANTDERSKISILYEY